MSVYEIHSSFRFTQQDQNRYLAKNKQLEIRLKGDVVLHLLILIAGQPYPLNDASRRWLLGFGSIQSEEHPEGENSFYKAEVSITDPKNVRTTMPDTGFVRKINMSEWEAILSRLNPNFGAVWTRRPVWKSADIPKNEKLPPGMTRKWLSGAIDRLVAYAQDHIGTHSNFADFENYTVRKRTHKMPEVELRSVIAFAELNNYKGFGRITPGTLEKIGLYLRLLDEAGDLVNSYN